MEGQKQEIMHSEKSKNAVYKWILFLEENPS